ncbi:MAG: Rho termination factor N-terminal domain-containing protein [Planctomycetota bacterium]
MPTTKVKRKSMKMPQIKNKAKSLGITPGKMKKADLIHSIQIAEGCTPCFGRSDGQCQHTGCCFMPDCL